ncbi:MAG: RIP metalloprotease RseP [Syntrophales bacterium]|nr:RIP metalloprotease RseP [Syntrophales bacterium]
MTSLVSVIVLLGVLIFVHELGHFLMAKRFGVGVLKFSLGFGPKLVGKRIGETEYMISLIPLGGYVRLLGESETEALSPEDLKRSFIHQSVWRRIAIVSAGPLFNFLLAIFVFAAVNVSGVPVLTSEIGEVLEDSAAHAAGIKAGDRVLSINGKPVERWDKMAEIIGKSDGQPLKLSVDRNGSVLNFDVTPRPVKVVNIFGEEVTAYKIGVAPAKRTVIMRQNPIEALWTGVKQTWIISKLTILSIVKIIGGTLSPRSIGGPILIAQMAGSQVQEGIVHFILFMGLLSVNLGILNLLPIPVLDGGHLMFYAIEVVRGKALSLKWREKAQQVGFIILIMIMIFVMAMDIDRLEIKPIQDFTRFFMR